MTENPNKKEQILAHLKPIMFGPPDLFCNFKKYIHHWLIFHLIVISALSILQFQILINLTSGLITFPFVELYTLYRINLSTNKQKIFFYLLFSSLIIEGWSLDTLGYGTYILFSSWFLYTLLKQWLLWGQPGSWGLLFLSQAIWSNLHELYSIWSLSPYPTLSLLQIVEIAIELTVAYLFGLQSFHSYSKLQHKRGLSYG